MGEKSIQDQFPEICISHRKSTDKRHVNILTDLTIKKKEEEEKRDKIRNLLEKYNHLKSPDDRKGYFLERFVELGGNISHLCKEIGISRQRYYQWLEEDPEFSKRVDDEREGLIDWMESQLMKRMQKEDTVAIIFGLKTQAKHRGYVEKVEHDMRGAIMEHRKIEIEVVRRDGEKEEED